jgi:ketosteroid isomerase-like protein
MTTSQSEHENLAQVRRAFDAFAAGDMPTLTELIAVDAVWNIVPTGVLAGNYRGRDQILAWFGQLHQETNGTFRSTPTAFAATEDRVFVQSVVTAARNGKSLNSDQVLVISISSGKMVAVEEYFEDYAGYAAFWN